MLFTFNATIKINEESISHFLNLENCLQLWDIENIIPFRIESLWGIDSLII